MKLLLLVSALIEVGAGVALLSVPSAAVALLLGSPLGAPAAVTLGRAAGAALLALGIANGLAQYDAKSCAAQGLVGAMAVYNLAATLILAAAGVWSQPVGVALWPAVVLHAGMTVWCIACLARHRNSTRCPVAPQREGRS